MERKYIFFLLRIYPESCGGLEIYNSEILKSLLRNKDEIDYNIISLGGKHYEKNQVSRLKIFNSNKIRFKRFGTLHVIIFLYLSYILFKSKVKHKIYIPYTSNFGKWSYVFLLLHKIFNFDYVIHIHGGGMRKWKRNQLHYELFDRAEHIFAVSEDIKQEYSKRTSTKVSLLLPLIPFDKKYNIGFAKKNLGRKYSNIIEKNNILYVGSLKPLKSPITLVKAFILLDEAFLIEHNLQLVIVGGGIDEMQLKKVLDQSDKKKYVCLVGSQPRELIPFFYDNSSFYVIPSQFEGTPLSLLEALYHGLVCLGSNTNGINTIIKHSENGLLFTIEDFRGLYKNLEKVVSDLKFQKYLSTNAEETYKKKYNYEDYFASFLEKICN